MEQNNDKGMGWPAPCPENPTFWELVDEEAQLFEPMMTLR